MLKNETTYKLSIILFGILFSFSSLASGFSADSIAALLNKSELIKAKAYLEEYQKVSSTKDSVSVRYKIFKSRYHMAMQENEVAFEEIKKAITLAEELNLTETKYSSKIQLLEWYRKERYYDLGMTLFHDLLIEINQIPLYSQARLLHRSAAICNEYAAVAASWNYLDSAINYSNKSLEISIANGFYDHQATSYTELGSIYKYLEDFEKAEYYFKKSMAINKERDYDTYINNLNNLGSVFLEQYKSDSAIHYFESAIKGERSGKNYVLLTDLHRGLKWAYLQKGDSLNYFRVAMNEYKYGSYDIQHHLNSKIHELTLSYEAQKKDEIIESSKQQKNLVIVITVFLGILLLILFLGFLLTRKKNSELKKLLEENEFLVGESNHRIKNNLQLITSLIGREVIKSNEEKPELVELSNKIKSIAVLHQHLYLKDAKEKIGADEYIENIIDNFDDSFTERNINTHADLMPFELATDKAMYLGLLITELITNSIKHAFDYTSGKHKDIMLMLEKQSGIVTLTYFDTGKGLSENKKPVLAQLLMRQLDAENVEYKKEGFALKIKFKE